MMGRQTCAPGRLVGVRKPAAASGHPTLGRIGSLEVRLASSPAEIRRAQELRYHVFFEETPACADPRAQRLRRDADRFDRHCEHLLVIDHDPALHGGRPKVVGTYRLLRGDVARRRGGFYTASEFNIAPLVERKPSLRFLELGRSCVLASHRNKRTAELLWHGAWSYVLAHGVDVMIGCASLRGTDPHRLALELSFLHHFARAPTEWRVEAHDHLFVEMDRLPASAIDARAAFRALPPLIKGYLRLGAFVGDGAVIDRRFGTTDVCVILPVAAIRSRYVEHYGADAGRYAVATMVEPRVAPLAAA